MKNPKFRIIKETESGANQRPKYYIQMRTRFLFIPCWEYIRTYDVDPIIGTRVYFCDLNDAKKYISEYKEGKSEVVYYD